MPRFRVDGNPRGKAVEAGPLVKRRTNRIDTAVEDEARLDADSLYRSPQAVARAIEANFCEFGALMRHWPQADVHDGPDCLWTLTDVPFPFFNTVVRARLGRRDVDWAIEAAINRGRSRAVPVLWLTGPSTRPSNLGASLEAHGFAHDPDQDRLGMAVSLMGLNDDLPLPSGLSIEQVHDIESLRTYIGVVSVAFGFPESVHGAIEAWFSSVGIGTEIALRHFIGRQAGEPVAAASLFLAAGVASLQLVGTVPGVRRRGIGSAMVLRLLREARSEGYEVAVLEAREAVADLYGRVGFREFCRLGHYVRAPVT
jgi:GNAT superfamily N-acetyltransferase